MPDAIAALIEAGLRVWMITGDRQETAINIGISCGLIHDPQHLLVRRRRVCPGAGLSRSGSILRGVGQMPQSVTADRILLCDSWPSRRLLHRLLQVSFISSEVVVCRAPG